MNEELKARLILKCKNPASPKDIWARFQGDYSYNWIRQKLDELHTFGILEKRKGGKGRKRNVVYYTTKDEDKIVEAEKFLKGESEEI